MNELDIAQLKAGTSINHVIGETLKLERAGRLFVAHCPFHCESTPSFTVYADHFHCFGCGAHGDVFAWLMRARCLTFRQAVAHLDGGGCQSIEPVSALPASEKPDIESRFELALGIWRDAIDPYDTPVQTYLRLRGVELPDASVIRFHPRCPRKDGPLPAMVALMTNPASGEPTGVLRTFLRPDGSGKATVAKPKMMLGTAGVVRLVQDERIGIGLGLAEGIETALSVMQKLKWGPVWAASSATAIGSFPILRATTLNVFADADKPGLQAAEACAARWTAAGQEVFIHIPPAGEDWDDATKRLRN